MRVVALNKFEYANVLRRPGDEFDTTSDKDADILVLAKQVARKTEEEQAPKPAPTTQTRAMSAEDNPTTRPQKKKYMRRDMRAEE